MHYARCLALATLLMILDYTMVAHGATFTVNSTGDEPDQTPGNGVALTATGVTTLRAAIMEANTQAGPHTIQFKIGSGAKTINVESSHPWIIQQVTLDGTTQPGYAGKPLIELHGTKTGFGISLSHDGCVVRGLVINNFQDGIDIYNANHRIESCYIGTDRSGTVSMPNGTGINAYSASGNVTIGPGNVISGNLDFGVRLDGNKARNYPENGAIKGNIIGLDATGRNAMPVVRNGITEFGQKYGIQARYALIGGTHPEDRNIISGDIDGISFSSNVVIQNNYIGTDITGLRPVAGGQIGISSPQNATIGGPDPGAGNVIAACETGIDLQPIFPTDQYSVAIQNNRIGVGADGITSMGCGMGIEASKAHCDIGGTGLNQGNTIACNRGAAINFILSGALPTQCNVRGNAIYRNNWDPTFALSSKPTALDINGDGITANDSGDGDTGPNGLQNYPLLSEATPIAGGQKLLVQGTLNSKAGQSYDLDFFANTHASSLTQPEGERYLGSLTVTTNAQGNANFSATFTCDCKGMRTASATATDSAGNTSEFAPCLPLGPPRNMVGRTWAQYE